MSTTIYISNSCGGDEIRVDDWNAAEGLPLAALRHAEALEREAFGGALIVSDDAAAQDAARFEFTEWLAGREEP